MLKKINTRHRRIIQTIIEHPNWTQNRIAQECGYGYQKLSVIVNDPLFREALNEEYRVYWGDVGRLAREKAAELVKNGCWPAIEFVLKTTGLNPVQKVEADVNTDIVITIDGKTES